VKVDGIYMNKSSNTISDVLEGATLNLQSADPSTTVEVSIANDTTSVFNKIQSFVDSYNSLTTDLATFSAYDDTNKTAAPLLGDGFLSEVRSRLSTIVADSMSGLAGNARFNSLALVGIKSTTNNQLEIDSTTLSDALDDHFEDVVGLFTQSFASQDSKISLITSGDNTQAGEYALVVNYDASGVPSSATINGKAATVDGQLIYGAKGSATEGLVMAFTSPGSGPAVCPRPCVSLKAWPAAWAPKREKSSIPIPARFISPLRRSRTVTKRSTSKSPPGIPASRNRSRNSGVSIPHSRL
jgi:flagellar hook-associated protein 2